MCGCLFLLLRRPLLVEIEMLLAVRRVNDPRPVVQIWGRSDVAFVIWAVFREIGPSR